MLMSVALELLAAVKTVQTFIAMMESIYAHVMKDMSLMMMEKTAKVSLKQY